MKSAPSRHYRLSRALGRFVTHSAALATFYRMPPFVSASAVVVEQGRVLMVIDPIRDEPVLPGGHLHWKERPEEGMAREVEEETGYRVEPASLLAVLAGDEWVGERGIVRIIYHAVRVAGDLRSSPEGEAIWLDAIVVAASSSRDAGIVKLWLARGVD